MSSKKIPILVLDSNLLIVDEYDSISEFNNCRGGHHLSQYALKLLKSNTIFIHSGSLVMAKEFYKGTDSEYIYSGAASNRIRRYNGVFKRESDKEQRKRDIKKAEKTVVILDKKFNVLELYTDSVISLSKRDNITYTNMKTRLSRGAKRFRSFLRLEVKVQADNIYLYKKDYLNVMIEEEIRIERVKNAREQYYKLTKKT